MTNSIITKIGLVGLGLTALTGCDPWGNLRVDNYNYMEQGLWDKEVVATSAGMYVRLPAAGALVWVTPDGSSSTVDLHGAETTRLVAAPDGETLLVFGSYPTCDTDDADIVTVEDCLNFDPDKLVLESMVYVVKNGEMIASSPIAAHYNALAFTSDGSHAVAYLDFSKATDIDFNGLLNLTEVVFIDMQSAATTSVPVGFAADRILFSSDDEKAVVLSESKVVVVDLTSTNYDILVQYALSLDVDDEVRPQDAELTPDGQHCILTVEGSSDLYVLDLENESINIVDLDGAPAALGVESVGDKTALVYQYEAQVDLIEHDYFSVESILLDEPSNNIAVGDGFALLYNVSNSNYHDVYRLETTNSDLIEYRMENPVESLQIAPDGAHAVAVTRPESASSDPLEAYADERYGIEVLDLVSDRGSHISLVSNSQPLGVAFSKDSVYALVLLDGLDDLLKINLTTGNAESLDLVDTPMSLGAFGEDGFFITHDSALGLVSFFDPATDTFTSVGGFATGGLFDDERMLVQNTEED
jgi:DNA-binding beta-propeller fold protein YncE